VFPVGIGLRDPRSQKRDLGHPSTSPFDIAEGQTDCGEKSFRVECGGIPHLAKNERDAPNFLHAALDRAACAPFFKERAHEVRGPPFTSTGNRGRGVPGLCLGKGMKLQVTNIGLFGP
jgi:hypothetical protein